MENRERAKVVTENYRVWKKQSLEDAGYFIIFNGFLESNILNRISGGALKLYIFLGLRSDNKTGESFYKIKTMSEYFGVNDRTITNWLRELEKLNLIKRMQLGYNSVSRTYLVPYFAGERGKK
ncbi:helix-turn-helix domain-containing protein (plasmid) [Weissella cibaria]|uniref:helix-turn-helix domain-containing protein n=1 Tax=Weissella confusa TaxID=1583 RepID=UPI00223C2B27|nr:helix-turn-helix domain-containing protein [Weissella confusa]MCT0010654.1 helix-turn-helix domain-containing protein [Weissella confusa]